jgi:hypothetical protein
MSVPYMRPRYPRLFVRRTAAARTKLPTKPSLRIGSKVGSAGKTDAANQRLLLEHGA